MIYQVNATLLFSIEDEAKDFYHDCELALAKATTINPGETNAEYSFILRLISNHDLDPNLASEFIEGDSNAP